MILLFGEKAHKTNNTGIIKSRPVENAGILANRSGSAKSSLFTSNNEFDTCEFSTPAIIDYSNFSTNGGCEVAFMSAFSDGISALSDGGFASMGGDCGFSSGDGGGFSSMC